MCTTRKYHWHTHQGIILEKMPLNRNQFIKEIYNNCTKRPTKDKAPGPNNIPNDIIKALPSQWQDLFSYFSSIAINKKIPQY